MTSRCWPWERKAWSSVGLSNPTQFDEKGKLQNLSRSHKFSWDKEMVQPKAWWSTVKWDCILRGCPLLGIEQRCSGNKKDTYGSPRGTCLDRYKVGTSRWICSPLYIIWIFTLKEMGRCLVGCPACQSVFDKIRTHCKGLMPKTQAKVDRFEKK